MHYEELILSTPEVDEAKTENRKEKKTSGAVALLGTVSGSVSLWHDEKREPYATIVTVSGYQENFKLNSRHVKAFLSWRSWMATGAAPSESTIKQLLGMMEGQARFASPCYPTRVRVAWDGPKTIYLDLANEAHQAVRITPDGWEVIASTELPEHIKFVRTGRILALPVPTRGGNLEGLRDFVNCRKEDFILLVAWAIVATRPTGPYWVLILLGEQGSAKTNTSRFLRTLLDPSSLKEQSIPESIKDLAIGAKNGWVYEVGNLSSLPQQISDAICRIATGGGTAARKLYEDEDETILAFQRPVILNGIGSFATRGDLIERALIVRLPVIPPGSRRSEADLDLAWAAAHPALLGALLDATVGMLKAQDQVSCSSLPRMADATKAALAAEASRMVPWEPGELEKALDRNQDGAVATVLEGSVLPPLLGRFAALQPERRWEGTVGDLYEALSGLAGQEIQATRTWPKGAKGLGSALDRLAPALRLQGWTVDHGYNPTRKTSWVVLVVPEGKEAAL